MFFDEIVRVRAGERVDRGGNTVADWSPAAVTRLTVSDVNVQPNTQNEGNSQSGGSGASADRNAVVTGWRVQSAPGVIPDVTAVDRIEWDGMVLEVIGEVARWSNPLDGTAHHVEFTMTRATG